MLRKSSLYSNHGYRLAYTRKQNYYLGVPLRSFSKLTPGESIGKKEPTLNIDKSRCLEALADLLFAYINKDADTPHGFEIDAVKAAIEILQGEYQGTKYTEAFFVRCERLITDNTI